MLRLSRSLLFYCSLTLISPIFSAEPPAPAVSQADAAPPEDPWLDEVRTQREAWEARRKAAKAASKARLRLFDPWRAAQMDAMEQETELRREFARERSEQRRMSTEARKEAHRRSLEQRKNEEQQMREYFAPYGWDNPWYYRGW